MTNRAWKGMMFLASFALVAAGGCGDDEGGGAGGTGAIGGTGGMGGTGAIGGMDAGGGTGGTGGTTDAGTDAGSDAGLSMSQCMAQANNGTSAECTTCACGICPTDFAACDADCWALVQCTYDHCQSDPSSTCISNNCSSEMAATDDMDLASDVFDCTSMDCEAECLAAGDGGTDAGGDGG